MSVKNAILVLFSVAISAVSLAKPLSADFTKETRPINRALHSSGYAPKVTMSNRNEIKAFSFEYTRTHDLALFDSAQRILDTYFIFPLMHLDAKDPKNYYFDATDYQLKLIQDNGSKVFYRLGVSIEHTGPKVHFNSLIPNDFDKMAEVFAGTIRHYRKGWANGFNWDIKYWEIWNEPDGVNNMWCLPDGDGTRGTPDFQVKDKKRRDLFCKFFVTCLKRLKSEFPDAKIGGPALTHARIDYFRALLNECKKAGVAPDFLSWHYYGGNVDVMINDAEKVRKLCDEYGFKNCELIVNEWHFLGAYGWNGLNSSPGAKNSKSVWNGPGSHNGIDSSCFTLSVLSRLQTSKYKQAYFYGCNPTGAWGYRGANGKKHKVGNALLMFGSIMRDCGMICASTREGTVTTFAAKKHNRSEGWLLVSDYGGKGDTIEVDVKGAKRVVSATILDYERDIAPVDVKFENGKLTLKKPIKGSTAFLVKFAL